MPRQNPFNKKTATTYALVNRPQHDPLIHNTDAPSQVFTEIASSSKQSKQSKIKNRGDLEDEFGIAVRQNEGEAAEHGIFYDDSKYDYMQHMREIGSGGGEATWIEATSKQKGKGKEKQSLEDALRETSLDDDDEQSVGGYSSVTRSSYSAAPSRTVYEQQIDVPEDLQGFRPDMDPRLREVLEALDDEAYVDDEEDIFGELAADGEEVERDQWEDSYYDNENDDGWESDETEKPVLGYRNGDSDIPVTAALTSQAVEQGVVDGDVPGGDIPAPSAESQDLLASLAASKRGADNKPTMQLPKVPKASDLTSSAQLSTTSSAFGRKKKRKGALTSNTGFSMTSSALARTDTMSLLDSRFDKIAEDYSNDGFADDEDQDNVSMVSGMTGMTGMTGMSKASGFSVASRGSAWGGSQAPSEAPSLVSTDQFNSVLDDFLGGATGQAKKRLMRKAGTQGIWNKDHGLKDLDQMRAELGPARLSQRYTQNPRVSI